MKRLKLPFLTLLLLSVIFSCNSDENNAKQDFKKQKKETAFEYSYVKVGESGAGEISAYDKKHHRIFTLEGNKKVISIIDISKPKNPVLLKQEIVLSAMPNSVDIYENTLAIAVEGETKQDKGFVLFYDIETLEKKATIQVGFLPDMVKFSPNGKYLLCANEGEPAFNNSVDPVGSVSIIELNKMEHNELFFDAFEKEQEQLMAAGMRISGLNAKFTQDIEPEYIAISKKSDYAWVTLQENNAVARINIEKKQIENIFPLGYKDHSLSENSIDASDKDHSRELKNWPVFSMYQPDAIATFHLGDKQYFATANEGERRNYQQFDESVRIKNLPLDSIAFPNARELKKKKNLGRLHVSKLMGDENKDGFYEKLYAFGARSFTIWDASNGELKYDSKNEIDQIVNKFSDDKNNDKGGSSPEGIYALQLSDNKVLLAVTLEDAGGAMLYEITDVEQVKLIEWLHHEQDNYPEGLLIISPEDSPNGNYIVVLSNEGIGTVSFYFPK